MNTDLNPEGPPPEPAFDLTKIVPRSAILQPGVYFDLPEEIYHGSFGLSYSGIKHMRISPYNWWVRSPLNPKLAEVQAEEESDAKLLGQAYDARIVCGKEHFYSKYAPSISHKDFPHSLRTADDMRKFLEQSGLKKSGNKDELIERILASDPRVQIWDVIEQGHKEANDGKTLLDYGMIEKIEMAAAMIERHPELSKAMTGGVPQVSVVWTCEKTGIPLRVRYDYLKPKVATDLKTLQPRDDQPVEMQIGKEIGYRKYYIQAALYLEAAARIPEFLKAGQYSGKPPEGMIDALIKHPKKEWLWIFQLKGVAPVAKGRLLRSDSHLLTLGQVECDNAKHLFRACLDKYGSDPWVDPEPIIALDEADVPAWSLL